MTFVIGEIPVGSLAPVGGDFPLIVVNPNTHFRCEDPGTCILSGGTFQLENLRTNDLVEAFLSANGLPPPPTGYLVDSSNLLVEGITFTGVFGGFYIFAFSGRGNNMKLINCLITNQTAKDPPDSAFQINYASVPGIADGEELYSSLTLEDCVIENNDFQYAIFNSYWAGDKPDISVTSIDLVRTSIKNNRLPGFASDGTPYERSIFINSFFQRWSFYDSEIVNNTIGRSEANIRLVDGEIGAFENFVIDNIIVEDLNPTCTDVLVVTTDLDFVPFNCTECPAAPLTVIGCEELSSPGPTPTAVVSPIPTTLSVTFGPNPLPTSQPGITPTSAPNSGPTRSPVTFSPRRSSGPPVPLPQKQIIAFPVQPPTATSDIFDEPDKKQPQSLLNRLFRTGP
jgi:hypothetical protein